MHELTTKGAAELARLIASRQTTASDVIDAHLARIAEVDGDLHAITATLTDEARTAAAAVDRAIAAGEAVGPLAGVPFTVKENVDVAGSATTWGVAAMAGQIATTDAPSIARLREAGAIPLARTNMPDFAFRWDTVSGRAGRTFNPWDAARTAGGSSGGEAVALATGMTPLGVGNDLGGSLRVPSQFNGTAAIRPSRGRVADSAVTQPFPPPISMQMTHTVGPMARHIEDLRLALEVMAAPDPEARDPRWVPAPLALPAAARGTRVAVVRDPAGLGVDPHVAAGLDRAAGWLSDAGYEVVDAEPPQVMAAVHAWVEAIYADVAVILPGMQPIAGEDIAQFLGALIGQGVFQPVDQAAQLKTWIAIHELGTAWARFLVDHPVILSPVSTERAWPIGDDVSRVGQIAAAMRMVVPVNILGLPSCAVPVGADEGLPQGVQLIGARFTESRLLDAGQAIEDRAPVLTPMQPRVAVPA